MPIPNYRPRIWGDGEARPRGSNSTRLHGDYEGVMFTYELLGALLPFSCRVVIGEVVVVEAMIGSTIVAIEDGEGGAR